MLACDWWSIKSICTRLRLEYARRGNISEVFSYIECLHTGRTVHTNWFWCLNRKKTLTKRIQNEGIGIKRNDKWLMISFSFNSTVLNELSFFILERTNLFVVHICSTASIYYYSIKFYSFFAQHSWEWYSFGQNKIEESKTLNTEHCVIVAIIITSAYEYNVVVCDALRQTVELK